MNPTNFTEYLTNPPEADLDLPKRVFFQVSSLQELESVARKQSTLDFYNSLPLSKILVAQGPVRALQVLALHPSVRKVFEDQKIFLCSQRVLDAIGIPVITGSYLHLDGKGVKIALLDSGINPIPDLQDAVETRKSFISKKNGSGQERNFHGTAIGGIIGGRGILKEEGYRGIAPAVHFIDVQVFDSTGVAYLSDTIEALTWANLQTPDLIVFGGVMLPGSEDVNPLTDLCQEIILAGGIIVAPAGNFGPESGTVSCPACIPGVIAVGAVTQEGEPAFFSSRGSSNGDNLKPDVVLPGVGIQAPKPTRGDTSSNIFSGTSTSTAICAGLLALILSGRKPIPPHALRYAIQQAAENISQDPLTQGRGLLNGITLARYFNLLHPPPAPFKQIISSSIILTVLLVTIIIVAFFTVSFLG
ncbi:MAG: peptidase S8 family protein [Promethearchaeota archaeon CR_4]|nr:MAG: peptidase S8 family protein [Candidatus Lokiarchaeota archaeon CR_4]